jgi:uncharacterized YigZ family protein
MIVDSYESIDDGEVTEIKVKGSRFLGQAVTAQSREIGKCLIEGIRSHYHDARHVCSAMRFGPPHASSEFKDDDGEPSGTAGAPILDVLVGSKRYDLVVAVTRYFGGVKLGTGGLARAYAEAAKEALAAAPVRVVLLDESLILECAYGDVGAVEAILAREAAAVRSATRTFEAVPRFDLKVKRSCVDHLKDALTEGTNGRIRIVI